MGGIKLAADGDTLKLYQHTNGTPRASNFRAAICVEPNVLDI